MARVLDVNTRLKQENQFLHMQTAQYETLRAAIDETRRARHDLPAQLPGAEMEGCVVLQNLLDNAYNGQLGERDGVFQSSKRPGLGVGLQSVARISGKNGGYCRFLYGSGMFTANVMLRG